MVTDVLLWGAIGGLLPDLLRIAKAKGSLKEVGGLNVLISAVVLAFIGAIAATAIDASTAGDATLVGSLTAGFTGPEVISRLAGGVGGGNGGPAGMTAGGGSGILRWWRM